MRGPWAERADRERCPHTSSPRSSCAAVMGPVLAVCFSLGQPSGFSAGTDRRFRVDAQTVQRRCL